MWRVFVCVWSFLSLAEATPSLGCVEIILQPSEIRQKKTQPLHGFTTAKRQDWARVQYSGDFESHLILAFLANEIRELFLIPRCAVE